MKSLDPHTALKWLPAAVTAGLLAAAPAAAAPLDFRVTKVSGYIKANGWLSYPTGTPPCDGLISVYIGGVQPGGSPSGGSYKAKIGKTKGLDRGKGKLDFETKARFPYEQSGSAVCAADDVTLCGDKSLKAELNMRFSVRGRRVSWDPGGRRGPDDDLIGVGVVPMFDCATPRGRVQVQWMNTVQGGCRGKAPPRAALAGARKATFEIICEVRGKLLAPPPARPAYGVLVINDFIGRRTLFTNDTPVLAEHRVKVTLAPR